MTGLLSPVDPVSGNCSQGGVKKSLFDWKESQWIGGTLVTSKWAIRESVKVNEIRTLIDFPSLQNSVTTPVTLSIKTALQNQVFNEIFCEIVMVF